MIILVVKLFNFNIFGVFRRMNFFFFFFFFFFFWGGGGVCGFMWIYFRGHHFIGLFYGAISIVNCLLC